MKKIYISIFAIFIFSGLMFAACDVSKINGEETEDLYLSCSVQSIDAVEGYMATWENCSREDATERLHRVMLLMPDGETQVKVSDADYNGHSPVIWASGEHLMVMYAENRSADYPEKVSPALADRIELKKFTLDGELVSEETLMEVEPGTFGTFQLPFGKVERGPNSTLVYWADNKVEGVVRAAHLVEIENGEVFGRQYLDGIRSVNTPHAILIEDRYLFAFMSILTLEEEEELGVENDTNSIFLVETDAQFQPLGEETIINVGGDSDLGYWPSVAPLGDKYGVLFLSNEEQSPNRDRLNIRVYDPEAGEVIHSETADQYTYINYQGVTDAAGNLAVFYTESDGGFASGEYNLRVTTMDKNSFQTEDRFVMSVSNPNFYIERLSGNDIRLYYGAAGDRGITATELNLDSVGH